VFAWWVSVRYSRFLVIDYHWLLITVKKILIPITYHIIYTYIHTHISLNMYFSTVNFAFSTFFPLFPLFSFFFWRGGAGILITKDSCDVRYDYLFWVMESSQLWRWDWKRGFFPRGVWYGGEVGFCLLWDWCLCVNGKMRGGKDCWKGGCWGLVLGILGGGGGGGRKICVYVFFFPGWRKIFERTFASDWFLVLRQGGIRSCRIMTARSMKIYWIELYIEQSRGCKHKLTRLLPV